MEAVALQAVIDQVVEAQGQYPGLELTATGSGRLEVAGTVCFDLEHKGHRVQDAFDIRLILAEDHPAAPPIVYESGGRIPAEYGHFMQAGNLCLGAPVEVRGKFARHPNLLRFINEQVVPYLFSYGHKRDFGFMPYGEPEHASLGLIDYYMEFFATSGLVAMKLIKLLADGHAAPLLRCPCRSGQRLHQCHGSKLDQIQLLQPAQHFETELRAMVRLLQKSGHPFPLEAVAPKRMLKQVRRARKSKRK